MSNEIAQSPSLKVFVHPPEGRWPFQRADQVPALGTPEHLRLAGYHDGMTAEEKVEFLYRRCLQHQLHGYG